MYYAIILLSSSKISYIVITYISRILFITFFINIVVNYLHATEYPFGLKRKHSFIDIQVLKRLYLQCFYELSLVIT